MHVTLGCPPDLPVTLLACPRALSPFTEPSCTACPACAACPACTACSVSYTEEYEDLGTPKGWPDVPKPSSPLVPVLAQLTRLRELSFSLLRERAVPSLPPEWWLRGSFPRLQQ